MSPAISQSHQSTTRKGSHKNYQSKVWNSMRRADYLTTSMVKTGTTSAQHDDPVTNWDSIAGPGNPAQTTTSPSTSRNTTSRGDEYRPRPSLVRLSDCEGQEARSEVAMTLQAGRRGQSMCRMWSIGVRNGEESSLRRRPWTRSSRRGGTRSVTLRVTRLHYHQDPLRPLRAVRLNT